MLTIERDGSWLGEDDIKSEPEGVIKHSGQQLAQHLAGLLNAGVGVHFDEPHGEIGVQHEVVAEDLETVLPVLLVNLVAHRTQGDVDQFFYARDYAVAEVHVFYVFLSVILTISYNNNYIYNKQL